MGTYENQYAIDWLNANPNKLELVSQYSKSAILDSEEVLSRPKGRAILSGNNFLAIFNLPLNSLSVDLLQNLTLGELISGLTSYGIKYTSDSGFPQTQKEQQYLADLALQLFNPQQ